ncbi:MAG: hypothetical protein ACXVPN_09415 [Bacteroidia bacterium]
MSNYYIFLCLAGQLLIYFTWSYFVKRESSSFWKVNFFKHCIFLLALLTAACFHVFANDGVSLEKDKFYLLKLSGEFILKTCFIITLSARLAYVFFVDRSNLTTLQKTNRAINSLTALMLIGFILFNVTSYVWLSEIMVVPVSLFFYSLQK